MSINRLIVRCAETTVFFRDNYEWVSGFVKKNADFRIDTKIEKMAYKNGNLLWTTQEIRKVTEPVAVVEAEKTRTTGLAVR